MSANNDVTVLVTGVGAPPGVSIMKAIRHSQRPIKIIGADADPESVGLFCADASYITPLVADDLEDYINRLVWVCREEGVKLVFFGSEVEMKTLCRRKSEIEQRAGCLLVLNHHEQVETFFDKWRTVEALRSKGIGVPESAVPENRKDLLELQSRFGLPLLIKPRFGSGSRNVFLARTQEQLDFFIRYVPNPVVQQLLLPDEEEYTVGIYKAVSSSFVATMVFRRRLAAGVTYKAELVEDLEIDDLARRFSAAFPVFGPLNLQLRRTVDGLRVFEVNLRPSSSVVMRAHFGLNEPELCIRDMLFGEELTIHTESSGCAFRYWDEVFVETRDVESLRRTGVSAGCSFPKRHQSLSGHPYLNS